MIEGEIVAREMEAYISQARFQIEIDNLSTTCRRQDGALELPHDLTANQRPLFENMCQNLEAKSKAKKGKSQLSVDEKTSSKSIKSNLSKESKNSVKSEKKESRKRDKERKPSSESTKKSKKSPRKMSTRSMRVQNSVSVLDIENGGSSQV